jgi:hypothetical protein
VKRANALAGTAVMFISDRSITVVSEEKLERSGKLAVMPCDHDHDQH